MAYNPAVVISKLIRKTAIADAEEFAKAGLPLPG